MSVTREQLNQLTLVELKETAKSLGLSRVTGIRKAQLIDNLLQEQERLAGKEAPAANEEADMAVPSESRQTVADAAPDMAAESPASSTAANTGANVTPVTPNVENAGGAWRGTGTRTRRYEHTRQGRPGDERMSGRHMTERNTRRESGNRNYERNERQSYSNRGYNNRQVPTFQNLTRQSSSYSGNPSYSNPSYNNSSYGNPNLNPGVNPNMAPNANDGENPNRSYGGPSYSGPSYQNNTPYYERGLSERSERPVSEYSREEGYRRGYEEPRETEGKIEGILEIMPEGYGFIRFDNYLPGDNDVYVSSTLIHRFFLRTGDYVTGTRRYNKPGDKFMALVYLDTVNGVPAYTMQERPVFEKLTPIFPDKRIRLESPDGPLAMRIVDLISPIGKGQRGMIVSQPKAGKTTLLKQIAKAIVKNEPNMHVIILLIDERPEEVTDIKETVLGDNVEVVYSTFDELPEHHKRVAEMTLERAKRLVEQNEEVVILLDSITRLARAYNLTVTPSGKTLSGGLDPTALYGPKRFFGAARNTREGGSMTILATALVETGSKMDDVVFEEFKGTGNMELVLNRKLSEKRVFPAIDLAKSSTRREDLLLSADEEQAVDKMRKALSGVRAEEAAERIIERFYKSKTNDELVQEINRNTIL